MGDGLAGLAREIEKQFEFGRREAERFSAELGGVGFGVDDEVAGFDDGDDAFGGAAEMGTDAGEKFLDAEGLGDVVVGAGVEGLDFALLVLSNGEDDDRSLMAAADGAADFDAAHVGHHEVGHDEVGNPVVKDAQALFGVVGGAHVEALRGECGAQHAGDLRLIVDDEDAVGHKSVPWQLTSSAGARMILLQQE